MFGLFKKKKDKAHVLGAPAKGKAVSLKEVSDPTFSEGILGDGVAVIPSEGKIYAPADGTIGMVFDTLHAISLTTDFGAEVLIHVGLDTVQLKGEGFEGHVKAGDTVKKGKNVNIKCDTFLNFFYPIFLTSSANNSPAVLYSCIRRG